MANVITKSELIERIAQKQSHLQHKDIELSIKSIIEQMSSVLSSGGRIEVRGFGSFSLHFRPPRMGRNPKTGETVSLDGKYVPHFKPGKQLKERINKNSDQQDHREDHQKDHQKDHNSEIITTGQR